MATATSSSSESKNILRNMIVTVLTTVIGATIVYFLGFNNKKSSLSKLEREEVTVDAWKTLVTVENVYTKNNISLMRDAIQFGGFKGIYQESVKESEKFQSSVEGLIATDGIDKDLVSVLKRRLENEKSSLPVAEKFFMELDGLVNTAVDKEWAEKQLSDSIIRRFGLFAERTKGMTERAVADIEGLSKTLSERYDQPFNIADFVIIQIYKYKKDPMSFLEAGKKDNNIVKGEDGKDPEAAIEPGYFTGKWNANGATITLAEDGKMKWLVSATDEAQGTWKLLGDQLVMEATLARTKKTVTWQFNLANIVKNSFNMMLAKEPYNNYKMTRL